MKLKHLFAAAAVAAGLITCTCAVSAATAVNVSVPEFNVVVNGRFVENDYRPYPFVVYNDITYFPMTYADCAFLGVQNDWSYLTGNVIATLPSGSGIYDDIITPEDNTKKDSTAYIAEGPITVNGTYIYNDTQQYPIISYRDILYFPLTWDWCQAFGWNISFDAANGLYVASAGYENNGYVNYYYANKNSYNGYTKSCHIGELADKYPDRSGSYSYSPNHYRRNTYTDGYVEMYSLYDINYIYVSASEVARYNLLGWYTYDQLDAMFLRALSFNSISRVENSVNKNVLNSLYSSDPGKARITELLAYYKQNYISVFSYDLSKEMAIPKWQIEEYKNAGWFTYDQFAINLANSLASQGKYDAAVAVLSLAEDGEFSKRPHNYTIPEESHDSYYDSVFATAKRTYATPVFDKGCPIAIANTFVDEDKYGSKNANFVFVNVSYKDITRIRVSFTCYDASGKPTDDYTYSDYTVHTADDSVDIKALDADVLYTDISENDKTSYIGNIVVHSVTFADGTKWTK